jgi:hypothetical protein
MIHIIFTLTWSKPLIIFEGRHLLEFSITFAKILEIDMEQFLILKARAKFVDIYIILTPKQS